MTENVIHFTDIPDIYICPFLASLYISVSHLLYLISVHSEFHLLFVLIKNVHLVGTINVMRYS